MKKKNSDSFDLSNQQLKYMYRSKTHGYQSIRNHLLEFHFWMRRRFRLTNCIKTKRIHRICIRSNSHIFTDRTWRLALAHQPSYRFRFFVPTKRRRENWTFPVFQIKIASNSYSFHCRATKTSLDLMPIYRLMSPRVETLWEFCFYCSGELQFNIATFIVELFVAANFKYLQQSNQ